MEEILGSVSMLAQDQYGNYVVQVHAPRRTLLKAMIIHFMLRLLFSYVNNVQVKLFDFIFWSACLRCQKAKIV